jgi:hypothetical protein
MATMSKANSNQKDKETEVDDESQNHFTQMREFMMELKREQELTRIQLENGFQQGLETIRKEMSSKSEDLNEEIESRRSSAMRTQDLELSNLPEKQLRIGESGSLPPNFLPAWSRTPYWLRYSRCWRVNFSFFSYRLYFTQGEQDKRISQKKGRDSLVGSLLRFDEEQTVNADRIYFASDKH